MSYKPSNPNGQALMANSEPVVIASNQSAIPVTGTFWQATQPVSGTVALGAGASAIGTVEIGATSLAALETTSSVQSGTWTVGLSAGQTLGTVTNLSQLGGTAISMNTGIRDAGTQRVTIATNDSVPVTGTFWQATQPVSIATLPTLAAGTNNIGDVDVASLPGTVATDITAIKTATELLDNAVGVDGAAIATGMLRVGGTDGTNNQTISVTTAGAVNIADGGNSITVDGTFWQATQPVSGPLTDTQLRATAVPVSGTVEIGATSLAALETTSAIQSGTWTVQPGNTANTTPWLTKINDGTNSATVKAASAAAVATDPALVVAVSPNNSVAVTQAVAANLNATVTGVVELGATSLAALENISVTVPGTVDLGTISLTALENITVSQSTPANLQSKSYGAVTTAAPTYTNGTDNSLSLTTNGALRVDVMSALPAGTNAIGKLSANDGVDIGDVTINNASIAVTGTFWQATQPVSIASVPSHPVTNAGTFAVQVSTALPAGTNNIGDVDVLSIVPGTGATNLGKQTDSVAGATDTGVAVLAIRDDALTTLTPIDGDYTRFRVNSVGRLWTSATIDTALPAGTNAIGSITNTSFAATQSGTWNIGSITTLPALATGANTIGAVNVNGTVPVSGTFWQATQPVSIASMPSTPVTGTFWQATQPVSLASVPSHAVTNAGTFAVQVTSAPTTAVTGTFWQATQPVSLASVPSHAVTNAGSFAVQAAQSGTWNIGSITTLPALPAGTNAIGKLAANTGVIIGAVEMAPATTNVPSNATTTAYAASLIVKASAGTIYNITGYNAKTSAQFIQIHDSATLPANAAVPKVIFLVPPASNFAFDLTPFGRSFAAGITICNSSTGPTKTIGAADCWFDAQYK